MAMPETPHPTTQVSDTPETDEHEHFVASFSPKYCDPEFCRTLERQRDQLKIENASLRAELDQFKKNERRD